MYYLNLDENNYLLSVATVGGGVEVDIDLNKYDLTGHRISAHKWNGETLIFDGDKFAEIEAEKAAKVAEAEAKSAQPTETEQLRADVDYIAAMTGVELL
jgi:hypothetical protein